MELAQPILLGLLQGATEFLPVSSSGHLVLAETFFKIKEAGLAFDVALHLGTLVAVVIYFQTELLAMARAVARPGDLAPEARDNRRLTLLLLVATIPGGLLGKLFADRIEAALRQPLLVAAALAGTGLILLWAEGVGRRCRDFQHIGMLDAVVLGLAQAFALVPGVSRSGATMTVGLFRGLDRTAAARFSFLMSVPIIAGAGALHLIKIVRHGLMPGQGSFFALGFVASAISGYLFIAFIMRYIQTRSFAIFAYYRFAVAAMVLGWVWWH